MDQIKINLKSILIIQSIQKRIKQIPDLYLMEIPYFIRSVEWNCQLGAWIFDQVYALSSLLVWRDEGSVGEGVVAVGKIVLSACGQFC